MSDETGMGDIGPDEGVDLGIPGFRGAVEVGRGGFGVVYRAFQPKFNRTVAIKVLSGAGIDSKTRERFERELAAMGALSAQPNIMTVYDAGFTDFGHPYIVMEYTSAGSLSEVMAARGAFSADEAVSIGVRMAEALASAHEVGILHRDVKPENVMVSPFGEPLLSDFGIAKMMAGPATRTGSVTASLDHAAPEVLEGKKPVEASDVYSLASSIYALMAGIAPFRQETDESLAPMLTRIMTTEVKPLDESVTPAAVFVELKRAMAKDPEERHGSARQFADALRSAAQAAGLVLGPVALDVAGTVDAVGAGSGPDDGDSSKTFIYQRIPRVEDAAVVAAAGGDATEEQPAGELEPVPAGGPTAEPEESDDRKKLLLVGVAALLLLFVGVGAFAAVMNGDEAEPEEATGSTLEGDWIDRQAALVVFSDETDEVSEPIPTDSLLTVKAGEPLVIPAEEGLTFSILSDPGHGTVSVEDDGMVYTSEAEFSGEDVFIYEACDAEDVCELFRAVVTVEGENPAPTVEDDTATTTAPEPVTISVLDNDFDEDELDPASLTIATEPANGSTVIEDDGAITYTPNADFSGTDTFEYEICDQAENPACARGLVTVEVAPSTITADNDASTSSGSSGSSSSGGSGSGGGSTGTQPPPSRPSASNDTGTTKEDTTGTFNVLANDTGQIDSWKIKSQPSNGSASKSGNSVSYKPKANYNGTDSLTYEICNSSGCDTATLNITITAVNDAPRATDAPQSEIYKNTTYTGCVLQFIEDVDGDSLTIQSVGSPSPGGSASAVSAGSCAHGRGIKYSHPGGWSGRVTIPFVVSDGSGGTLTEEWEIAVMNRAPVAGSDNLGVGEYPNVAINYTGATCNDSDPDGDPFWITRVSAPTGTFWSNPDDEPVCSTAGRGFIFYDPEGHLGPVTISYWITDGEDTTKGTISYCLDDPNDSVNSC